MLHNTLTVAEWANLWEGKIIKINVYWLYRMVTKHCSVKWLENYFSDEQKQKDAEAAAHFHIKAAKIAHVIIILRTFVLENLIAVISVLLDIHSIFICSITGFRAIDYPPPPPCANTSLSYIVQNMWTRIKAKAFVGTRRGTICYKTFPNFYMFHCKKTQFLPKIKSL